PAPAPASPVLLVGLSTVLQHAWIAFRMRILFLNGHARALDLYGSIDNEKSRSPLFMDSKNSTFYSLGKFYFPEFSKTIKRDGEC
ncbi:MAG: hypothetical protein MUO43_08290, partial [Desulfobacterales bacterium]|nr:hypothetical protein [Desulfobacterales bacterium]